MRTDVFTVAFCNELSKLQERSFGFSPARARRTIEEELKQPIEAVFEDFEDAPVAAASLAQVHRARLRRGGIEVAVKVQRPNAERVFRQDFRWISTWFLTLDFLGVSKNAGWKDMLKEIDHLIGEELDYGHEVAAIRDIRKTLKRHKIYVPKPFEDHCTKRVIVMEFVRGVSAAEYIQVSRVDPDRARRWIEENGISRAKIATRLCHTLLRQMFEDNLCHGDIHPGNVMLLRKSRLALLDFGTVGSFDMEFITAYRLYLTALANRHFGEAADLMLRLSGTLPVVDLAQVRKDLIASMQRWSERTRCRNLPIHERSLATSADDIGKILIQYRFSVNWGMLKIGRTYHTLDMTISAIYPEIDYPKVIMKYQRDAGARDTLRLLATLAGLPNRVRAYASLVIPTLREGLLKFETAESMLEQITEWLLKLFRSVFFAGAGFALLLYLHQHHKAFLDRILDPSSPIRRFMDRFTVIDGTTWAILGLIIAYTCLKIYLLVRRATRPAVRLPWLQGVRSRGN
jgi:ubiquinone biosynthesis protein